MELEKRYVIVYFSILYLRYQAGKVTDEMLSLPKSPLIAIGLLEALAAASGMAAGELSCLATCPFIYLPWEEISVQPVVWLFSGGSCGSGTGSLMDAGIFWSILMIISFLLQAADTVLKETIFLDAAQRLKGGTVDLFVINSYGSAYQAAFICVLLPFLSNLWGIPFGQLPNYLKDGAACFLNVGAMSNRCNGAPLLPVFCYCQHGFQHIAVASAQDLFGCGILSCVYTFRLWLYGKDGPSPSQASRICNRWWHDALATRWLNPRSPFLIPATHENGKRTSFFL
ncbi:UNVERIFIED_CONTAM: protein CLT3, chloroplastic [Sesamum calycinum]|uniref:Protein CLT3, chloroplastic n=1 Tax=Sesamum calycinum TaxID=2727403 RepID=A0AAW2SC57_9LAMI